MTWRAAAATLAMMIGGCSVRQRPVLYPNAKLNSVGPTTAQQDIEDCLVKAAQFPGLQGQAAVTAGKATRGAATGAAVGGAVGAVRGNAGNRAAAGAAGGGALGTMDGLVLTVPDTATRRFVEQCLRDKGYQPIGWQ